jgi:hypothetical protein
MDNLNAKHVEAKKTKAALDKHIETRGQKKKRLENERDTTSSHWLKNIRLDPSNNPTPKKQ